MRTLPALLIPALLALLPGCKGSRAKGPDWALAAPAGTVAAFSGQAGWILDRPDFQAYLRRFPLAEQSLELFLKRARISPKQESGRISFYLLDLKLGKAEDGTPEVPRFLIQFGGFRDAASLHAAVVESFPAEGSLVVDGRDLPLHVILDVNQWHIRALLDEQGRVWIGDLSALAALGGTRRPDPSLVSAAGWIEPSAPLQGFLRPEPLLQSARNALPKDANLTLPRGLDALAWSVSPAASPEAPYRFALSLSGSREGVSQAAPWLQRLVALTGSAQGGNIQAAEMLEEPTRIGVRAQLTGGQLEAALARIAAPMFRFDGPPPAPPATATP